MGVVRYFVLVGVARRTGDAVGVLSGCNIGEASRSDRFIIIPLTVASLDAPKM